MNAEPFDVKNLVAGCCARVNPVVKPVVKLNDDDSDDIGEAHTDEGRLRQIVFNLLSNTLKITEDAGVAVRTTKESGHQVIAVSDTGTGIPPMRWTADRKAICRAAGADDFSRERSRKRIYIFGSDARSLSRGNTGVEAGFIWC